MPHPRYSATQVVQRGRALYDAQIRNYVEPGKTGQVLVIDIETGDYELGADDIAASHRLQAKHPGAALYAMRVGSETFGRIGNMRRGGAA